jgi:hypothetical protein
MYHNILVNMGYGGTSKRAYALFSIGNFSEGAKEPLKLDSVSHFWDRANARETGPSDLFHARRFVKSQPTVGSLPADGYLAPFGKKVLAGNIGWYLFNSPTDYWISAAREGSGPIYKWNIAVYKMRDDYGEGGAWDFNTFWRMASWGIHYRFWPYACSPAYMSEQDMEGFDLWGYAVDQTHNFRYMGQEWDSKFFRSDCIPNPSVVIPPAPPSDLNAFSFIHNEYNAYLGQEDLQMLPNLYRNGFASAQVEAGRRLPEVHSNGIANVVEVAKAILSIRKLLKGDFSSLSKLKNVRNLWLGYRYGYSTTKADIQEYASLASRLSNILGSDHIRVGGGFTRGDLYFSATITYSSEDVVPSEIREACDQFGLRLSAYNAWDLVPYSFVVDWFLDIGDMLERYDILHKTQSLNPVDAWYSCKTSYRTDDGVLQDVYMRFHNLNNLGAPVFSDGDVSDRTKTFRLIDGIALFG